MTKTYELQSIPAQDSNRLLALDAVRGIAVIGMYIQHFALNERNNFVSGNTMILFILCSGISYTMMAQTMERRAIESPAFCARVLARSVFIDLVGYLILMLNGPFGVVLQAYAMLFLLALPLVKCATKTLAAISAISFVICPPLMLIGMSLLEGAALLHDIAGGPLSALAWFPVFVAGMVVGRLNLRRTAGCRRSGCSGSGQALCNACPPSNLPALLQLARSIFQRICFSARSLCSLAEKYTCPFMANAVSGCAPGWFFL